MIERLQRRSPYHLTIATVATFAFLLAQQSFAQLIEDPGVIDSVVLYRDSARVTRVVEVPPQNGSIEVVVDQLPESLIQGSVVVESEPNASIGRVQVSRREVDDTMERQVSELEEEHATLSRSLVAANQQLSVITENLAMIQSLVDFSSSQTKQDLDRATLDVKSVTELADFAIARRQDLSNQRFKVEAEIAALTEKQEANQIRLQNLAITTQPILYKAKMLVRIQGDQPARLRVRYDVQRCGWSPSYVVYGDSKTGQYRIVANAEILQDSGEAWPEATLALSTSIATLRSDAPRLSPLRVSTGRETNQGAGVNTASLVDPFARAGKRQLASDVLVNRQTAQEQMHELSQPRVVQRRLAADAALEMIDGTFELPDRLALVSNDERQRVKIFEEQLSGEMKRIVIPLLSSYAYREVKLDKSLTRNLMSGPTDVFLDNQFIGETELPATLAGQSLEIGFGPDHQIRTRRELIDRTEETRGGNQLISVRYRIVINNLHDQVIACSVNDRIPVTDQSSAVTIRLGEADMAAISADPLYQRMRRPLGILQWDLEIPAKRSGSDAFDLEYGYQIEHEKSVQLTANDLMRQIQQDQEFMRIKGGGMGGLGGGFGGAPSR
jgi:uncharacterized protein (TIGR02231 family)